MFLFFGLIESKMVEHSIFSTTSGTTIEEYSNSLKITASLEGSYMFFSGAVKTNFHEDRFSYESYSFATVKSLIQKTQLRLPIDMEAEELKPYLTPSARSKLNDPSISPEYIFDIYGTLLISASGDISKANPSARHIFDAFWECGIACGDDFSMINVAEDFLLAVREEITSAHMQEKLN